MVESTNAATAGCGGMRKQLNIVGREYAGMDGASTLASEILVEVAPAKSFPVSTLPERDKLTPPYCPPSWAEETNALFGAARPVAGIGGLPRADLDASPGRADLLVGIVEAATEGSADVARTRADLGRGSPSRLK